MEASPFFCHISSARLVELVGQAKQSVCYAGPGIQVEPARALAQAAARLDPAMITVWVDFDERVMRMGYGDVKAVELLRQAGIKVSHAAGLRSALIIVDDAGYTFTPTPLYLEAEPGNDVRNALRLSREQVAEALARLSPVAKVLAEALADSPEAKERIARLPPEGDFTPVDQAQFHQVAQALEAVPPVKFDIARQTRVFEPYLQYVEMHLTGAAIQRHRITIPPIIQKLGGGKDLEGRLRTTLDLIEKGGKLSSKALDDELKDIRDNLTRSLGKDHGRVVLKAAKSRLVKRLDAFKQHLTDHQTRVKQELQGYLDKSKKQIIDYYCQRVLDNPPDDLRGQLLKVKPDEDDAKRWLARKLCSVIPSAESLIHKMTLDIRYKDVTYETLNRKDFLESVKNAYPDVNWEKAYEEFKAAREEPATTSGAENDDTTAP